MDEVATAGARVAFDSASALEGAGLTGNVHELGATFVWLGGSRLHSLVTQSLDVVNVSFPHLSIIRGDGEGYWP